MKIILATANKGKIREIRRLLSGLDADILTLDDFPGIKLPPEDADTFAGNALKKARAVFEATGIAALADDSGLEADFLGGRPGVRSTRYAGEGATDIDNCKKLLLEMAGAPAGKRGARFVCVAALVSSFGERVFEGELKGEIAGSMQGDKGFGYDPLFVPLLEKRTLADMTQDEKNEISHRGAAIRKTRSYISSVSDAVK